ncbi:MAG: hypothetical protein JWN04_2076 [Myxococcaceae bacterium]|nr:hypothetical protein [Myxococcaceae bacterium]
MLRRVKGERWLAYATAVAASLSLALAGLYPGNNPDTFGHLAQGRQIAELGHVPKLDTWSLLPGPPRAWLNYEWLSDLGTYLLYAQFGYVAVTLFKCLLLLITGLCLARTAFLLSGSRAVVFTSLAVVSTIPAIRVRLSDRPHVLGICLAAAYLLLLTMLHARVTTRAARRGSVAIVVLLCLLHMVWVNAHGSHLLGLAITGSFLVLCGREGRHWFAAVLGVQLLASCVSPYGPAIWIDALDHVLDPRYRRLISEWQPWRTQDHAWLQLSPALQAGALALMLPLLLRRGPGVRAALPVALLLAAACFRSMRFLAEFMLLSAPLLGVGFAALARDLSVRRVLMTAASASLALAWLVPYACAQLPPRQPIAAGLSVEGLPSATGTMLREHALHPRVFAAMQDSWYLMFAAPQSRFALDGRVPFYGPDYLREIFLAFADAQRFARMQRELGFDVVVVAHAASGETQVRSFVEHRPDWQLLLIEDLHATYVRRGVLDAGGVRAYPALEVLEPDYAIGWLLDADASRVTQIRAELAQLSRKPGSSGYRAWVEGILALAPLRRGRPGDGFRWPRNEADWSVYRHVRPLIERTASRASDVPIVAAMQAQLAALFCDFSTADAALERALAEGASREPMMAAQELALRRGEREQVARMVAAGQRQARGKNDPWLAELADGLEHPPACPK